jgi:spore coat protein JC
MWLYDKKLQYPVRIKTPNPRMAKYIITQYGGPDGELAASLRYLSQRFSMPTEEAKATLNDIGTEELAHLEMVGAMVHQLTRKVPAHILEKEGLRSALSRVSGLLVAASITTPFSESKPSISVRS